MNKRIFIAVNIPKKVKETISEKFISKFPKKGLKKVKEENLHITLCFIGYVNEEKEKEIEGKLNELEFSNFEFLLSGIGHFKGRVLWIGVKEGNEKMVELAGKVNESLGMEDEKFHAHLTIARNKFLKKKEFDGLVEMLGKVKFEETIVAKSVDLMESKLSPTGPSYSVLKKFELKSL